MFDTDYGEEDLMSEIDFEDLLELDVESKQIGSYLQVNAEHMQTISHVHIRVQLLLQLFGICIIMLSYSFSSLLNFTQPADSTIIWKVDESWITAWRILTPADNKYWYWEFQFTSSVSCESESITDHNCPQFQRTWLTNTLLNGSLLFGMVLTIFSITWTYYQLQGYYHKMNVSTTQ